MPSDTAIKSHLPVSLWGPCCLYFRQTHRQPQAKLEELMGHAAMSQNPGWQTLSETHELSYLQLCYLTHHGWHHVTELENRQPCQEEPRPLRDLLE